ncbi:MAG: DUF4175 family protein [Flavobacteriales bacterium]|nr:DUF4175 family protein [Flavobacteriales bacterium]
MSDSQAYQSLISRLDEFIRKYYKNRMIRGAMYTVALVVGTYLLVTLLEYFGRFNIAMRTFLFYSFLAGTAFVIVKYFMIPLFKMFRLGKTISHEQAAHIIGTHFPNVQDKLLNTLQLRNEETSGKNDPLMEAAINQKILTLKPISFASAIDLRQNRKYLKYALPPLAVVLILLFAAPSVLTKPTERLIKHGQLLAEEAPFTIKVLNSSLETPENTDFDVQIEILGNQIPDKVYVVVGGQPYLLEKENNFRHHYTFRNVQKEQAFFFQASGFNSDEYLLEVLPMPALIDFSIDLKFPSYIKRDAEAVQNSGDLTVPQGTRIQWNFVTRNADQMSFRLADSTFVMRSGSNSFSYADVARETTSYSVHTANERVRSTDSVVYQIRVIPDLHPAINTSEERDSGSYKQLYFTGDVKDDYGFKRLTFNYQYTFSETNGDRALHMVEIPVSRDMTTDVFFYNWNLSQIDLVPGDKLNYYFEVWDNDGVNGSKSTRSVIREFAAPTDEELNELADQQNEDIKDKLEESIKDAEKLQKELDELQRQLMDKKELTWQDKKKLEDLLKKQNELKNQVEQIQKQNQEKNQKQSEFKQQDESLLEKQKQLENLMDQVMTPELEKMMEELQKLMEELNKDEIEEQLEKMDLSNEDMEKELDRALEQFKQLEWEQKMEEAITELEKLAEQEEKLSEEAEDKNSNPDEIKEKQDQLNEDFKKLEEELKEIEKLNKELETPNETPQTGEKQEEIKQDMNKSSEELQKQQKSKASKSQKSAAKKMQEMAQQMESSMASNEQEKQEEDMEALRALLENIITLSFDQELLMDEFKSVDTKDPKFNKYAQTQRKLKDDAKMVEDSLFALSKRVPQLSAMVNHEINLVNQNMDGSLVEIAERKLPQITTHQQYVMTSFNNLALMLDEALKQMQQQSSCNKPGTGNCEKPGGMGKKPSASKMKSMQESMSKQLEELKKQGKNKGESKGRDGKMSQQLAEMAAKQAMIRKAVEEKAAELNQDGSGNGNDLKQIAKEMEQLQKDLVNDQVNEESMRRQQDIMTRLLKAENAERIREQEEQRKSNEARDYPSSDPMRYEEYLRRKNQELELLKTVPVNLNPYYKERVNAYFNKLGAR